MANGIEIGAGFILNAPVANFTRDLFETKQEMKDFPETSLPDVFLAQCKETPDVLYIFNKASLTNDSELGKWKAFSPGTDLADYLTSEQIADAYVAKEAGKGLSTTDVTAEMVQKWNGTTVVNIEANEDNTDGVYKLDITLADGSTSTTPNLIGAAGKNAPAYTIGTVESVANGIDAEVTITGADTDSPKLNFKIPKGADGVGADSSYTDAEGATTAIGGWKVGDTADAMSNQACWYKLLHPYAKPTATLSHDKKDIYDIIEDAATVTSVKLTAVVGKKSKVITSVKFKKGNEVINTVAEDVSNGGTFEYTLNEAVNTTTKFSVEVEDGDSTVTAEKTITFVGSSYVGYVDPDAVADEVTIKALTKSLKITKNVALTGPCINKKTLYAYPKSFGDLASIKDQNGFNYVGSFTKSEVTVDGIPYNAYISNDPATLTAQFKYTFS